MKRASRIWAICAVILMSAWGVKSEEARVNSGAPEAGVDTIRLDIQAQLDDFPLDEDGKWVYTYSGDYTSLDFDIFRFTHLTNAMQAQSTDPNGMQYWDGFTVCTSGDDTDYGMAGSSDGWITHQWGCMAGGGIDADGKFGKGIPYLVAYWGYNYEAEGIHSLQVDFLDGETHRPVGVWVCNHPWPYYGIQHDDGFAHSFADNGAYFRLVIHGLDEEGKEAGMPIAVPLATFHDNALDISTDWQWVDLTSLGQVSGIYFTLESTDMAGVLGMNTAAYFCLGGMQVLEHVDEIARPAGLEADPIDEHSVKVKWNAVDEAAYYRLYVDSVLVDSTESTSFTFTKLKTYTSYRFFAQAVSAYGESSDWGYVSARTLDLTPPAPPQNLRTMEVGMYKIVLTWEAGSDNIAVDKYAVYVDGKRYSRPKFTTVTITGLDPATTYLIEVETLDTSGNASERAPLNVTTLSSPTDVSETAADSRQTVYNLQGQVLSPQDMRKGGVYIVRQGNETKKQTIH